MKRALSIVLTVLFLCVGAWCTTVTSVTKIVGPDGQPFTGTITLQLPFAGVNSSTNQLILATPVVASVINGTITQPFAVTGNDLMSPAMPYSALYTDVSGNPVTRQLYYITGATFDVGSAPATPNFLNSTITFANNITATGNVSVGGTLGVTGATTLSQPNKTINANGYTTLALAMAAVPAGGVLEVPANTSYSLSASVQLPDNPTIHCANNTTSIITAPSGAGIFIRPTNLQNLVIDNCRLVGNGANSFVLDATGAAAAEGSIILRNNYITGFPTYPITFGTSQYIIKSEHNHFVSNNGCLNIGSNSDFISFDDYAFGNTGANDCFHVVGPNYHFDSPRFVPAGAGGTGADIYLDPGDATANTGGYAWIRFGKFGSDGGDSATRCKIKVNNANAAFIAAPLMSLQNNFFGVVGQKVFCFNNPIRNFSSIDDYFGGLGATGTMFDDNFTGALASFGQGQIIAPRYDSRLAPPIVATNGGRGFWRIDLPETASNLRMYHSRHEAPELRNRIAAPSEDMSNASWVKSNVTVTTGITDPLGTTRANTLTVASGTGNIGVVVTNTNMHNRFNIKFCGQAGTVTQMRVGVKDTTSGTFQELPTFAFPASPDWVCYDFDEYGVTAGHSYTLNIFIDSAGTVNIAFPMVDDYAGDYIQTPASAMVVNTGAGVNFMRQILSTVPTGTAPFSIVSTTPVANLVAGGNTVTVGTGNVTTAGTAVTNGTTQDQTGITVTGAATTDACTANIGTALPATWQTGIRFWCDVTATNTVTVHLQNPTAGSITPAATQVNVRVTR